MVLLLVYQGLMSCAASVANYDSDSLLPSQSVALKVASCMVPLICNNFFSAFLPADAFLLVLITALMASSGLLLLTIKLYLDI